MCGKQQHKKNYCAMAKCCVVSGCEASNRDFGTFLFCFPQAEGLRQRWATALGKPVNWTVPDSASVCWSHFDSNAVLRDVDSFCRLADAVPSKYLGTVARECNPARCCRFCGSTIVDELLGSSLDDMNRSEDSMMFLDFLLPNRSDQDPSQWGCRECFEHVKLTMRFIRNCRKASQELEEMAKKYSRRKKETKPNTEVKYEMDEFEEVPVDSVDEPDIKVEVSSLGVVNDHDNGLSDDEDNIPLAQQLKRRITEALQCAHCSFTCSKRYQLTGHMKQHKLVPSKESDDGFNCPNCSFTCRRSTQLASHRKKHRKLESNGAENEQTKVVSSSVNSSKSELSEHDCLSNVLNLDAEDGSNDSSSEPAPSNALQCPDCPYTCERLVQLASHKKKHSKKAKLNSQSEQNTNEFYKCEFCDFTCKFRRQMAGHRASHSNQIKKSKPSGKERDHMCSICGKILSTRGSFFVHMKYHNDQRDYSCSLCSKKFYSKRDVAMHVESFHEKKVFECEICGVKCTWKNALYKHMRKHDVNAFKHECSYCGKKFIAANELRLHVWRHTGQQLTCDICGAGYRFNFLLTQHKIREHGIHIDGVKLYKRFQKDKSDSREQKPPKLETDTSVIGAETQRSPEEATNSSYSSDQMQNAYSQNISPDAENTPQRNHYHSTQQNVPLLPAPHHSLSSLMAQQSSTETLSYKFDPVNEY